jgi:hypothetical protein
MLTGVSEAHKADTEGTSTLLKYRVETSAWGTIEVSLADLTPKCEYLLGFASNQSAIRIVACDDENF